MRYTMYRTTVSMRIVMAAVALTLLQSNVPGQQQPEVFVQTGHSRGVDFLALSDNQKYLVTAESFSLMKLWDVEATREIRTIKFEGIVNNVYFIDNEKFILFLKETAQIYGIHGEKIETINLPAIQDYGKKFFTPSRKYLYTVGDSPLSVRFYDMTDGSEIKLPEQNIDTFTSSLISLGYGYFGIVFDEYQRTKESTMIGNTGYVIYDEDLKVRKRGVIKGRMGIGGKLTVDAGLKFMYENIFYGENRSLKQISLETGQTLCSVPLKDPIGNDFRTLPDGKFMLGHLAKNELQNSELILNVDLTLIEFLDNCLYKQKKIVLEKLSTTKSFVFGKNGLLIAGHNDGGIKTHDPLSGRETVSFGVKPSLYHGTSLANDRLLNIWQDFTSSTKLAQVSYNLWNLKTASLEKFGVVNSTTDVYQKATPPTGFMLWYLYHPDVLFSKVPKEFFVDDFNDPRWKEYYERAFGVCTVFLKSPVANGLSYNKKEEYISVATISTKAEIARMYSFSNGEWIVITSEGYFNASPNGAKLLNVRVGTNVYSIDNFYEKFYNPGYVVSLLQGKKVEVAADIRKGVLTPPEVRIVSPEPGKECRYDTVTIAVSAKDMGGGIDEIRLYHNGKATGGDTRGMKAMLKENAFVKTYVVTLVDGANAFRAVGFSKDRTESNPSELVVHLAAPQKVVSMHIVTAGINTYKNPALNLNYAEPDARGIADFFRQGTSKLFKDVDIRELYNEQATKPAIVSQLGRLQNSNPQDVVLIYLAGHGENINDKWYFIPYELTYPERNDEVTSKGISSDELKDYIDKIKAQKILVLIDACKSGGVLVAFRGFEDRKALSQLSRSTGVHIVAASTKNQFAAEVQELGHGVFTYTLLQGLGGKAVGKGETVTVRKLMGYIEEQLPEITKRYKQEAQFPVVDSRGMDFPLVGGK